MACPSRTPRSWLPTDQHLRLTTVLGLAQADPGQTDTVFVRLTPGRHGVVDFLPHGTSSTATLGMLDEFSVT
jgi:hypothetical protein